MKNYKEDKKIHPGNDDLGLIFLVLYTTVNKIGFHLHQIGRIKKRGLTMLVCVCVCVCIYNRRGSHKLVTHLI